MRSSEIQAPESPVEPVPEAPGSFSDQQDMGLRASLESTKAFPDEFKEEPLAVI
jgi:hypothetical protein